MFSFAYRRSDNAVVDELLTVLKDQHACRRDTAQVAGGQHRREEFARALDTAYAMILMVSRMQSKAKRCSSATGVPMADGAMESWLSGGPYEQYVGRWSRKVAREFLAWLQVASGKTWGDVGCGTGALTETILDELDPESLAAIDRAEGFIAEARRRITDSRVRFEIGDATALPWPGKSCDVTVSGLVLNFVSNADSMVKEMARVTRPGGTVAAYVWDYAGGMHMMRHFWDVAVELHSNDAALDEAERFPLCQPEPLETLFRDAGLTSIAVRPIDIPTAFRDFDDYWTPFLGKQGPAPTYLASLNDNARDRIRDALKARLAPNPDGTIAMVARAWAVKGAVSLNWAL